MGCVAWRSARCLRVRIEGAADKVYTLLSVEVGREEVGSMVPANYLAAFVLSEIRPNP